MNRLIFNRYQIVRQFKTAENTYLKVLFRNEIETRQTGINHDSIGFYRISKEKKVNNYYPRLIDKIEPLVFYKIEEANDLCLRRRNLS